MKNFYLIPLFMGILLSLGGIAIIVGVACLIQNWRSDRARRHKARRLGYRTSSESEESVSVGYPDITGAVSSSPHLIQPPSASQLNSTSDGSSAPILKRGRIQPPIFEETESSENDKVETEDKSLGTLRFLLSYSASKRELLIEVIGADNLPPPKDALLPNSYVELQLLPDSHNRVQTRVHHRTVHPRWSEVFVFEGLRRDQLCYRYVQLVVKYRGLRGSPDAVIGRVSEPIDFLAGGLHRGRTWDLSRHLKPITTSTVSGKQEALATDGN